MQELSELRKKLKVVHGSMKRIAAKCRKSEAWVRLVLRGVKVDVRVIDAAIDVLQENRAMMDAKSTEREKVEQMVREAISPTQPSPVGRAYCAA